MTKGVYFEGPRIYSYGHHYLLGYITEFNGVSVALINRSRYSVTTSRHSGAAYSEANKAGLFVIECESLNEAIISDEISLKALVISTIEAETASLLDSLERAVSGSLYYSSAKSLRADIKTHNGRALELGLKSETISVSEAYLEECHNACRFGYLIRFERRSPSYLFSVGYKDKRRLENQTA